MIRKNKFWVSTRVSYCYNSTTYHKLVSLWFPGSKSGEQIQNLVFVACEQNCLCSHAPMQVTRIEASRIGGKLSQLRQLEKGRLLASHRNAARQCDRLQTRPSNSQPLACTYGRVLHTDLDTAQQGCPSPWPRMSTGAQRGRRQPRQGPSRPRPRHPCAARNGADAASTADNRLGSCRLQVTYTTKRLGDCRSLTPQALRPFGLLGRFNRPANKTPHSSSESESLPCAGKPRARPTGGAAEPHSSAPISRI